MLTLTCFEILCLVGLGHAALMQPTECGVTRGCYSECEADCRFVVTWKDNGAAVDFSLALKLDRKDLQAQWIALGLSNDQEMGDDSVTECVVNDNAVEVGKSYNQDKLNVPLTEVDSTYGLTNIQGNIVNGVLRCSFTQSKSLINNQVFNVNNDYYLLVADGRATRGVKFQHSVASGELPRISPKKANFQSTDVLSGTAKAWLVKTHASLMIFAWIFCASIGIVLARHYKPMWPNDQLFNERPWFTLHRGLMLLAFVLCIAGVVVIFVDVKGWSELPGASNWQKAHPIIGIIVAVLTIINPIMAACRPHPDARRRTIFNWCHWGVGTCAQIVSGIVMILGVTIARASVPFYCIWILIAWIVYQMVIEFMLEIFDCCFADKSKYVNMSRKHNPHVPLDRQSRQMNTELKSMCSLEDRIVLCYMSLDQRMLIFAMQIITFGK
ncbi:DOMON domain-containing protein frrs1L [Mactra antiquata]